MVTAYARLALAKEVIMRRRKPIVLIVIWGLSVSSGCSFWRALTPAPVESDPRAELDDLTRRAVQGLANDSQNGWNFRGSH
jgi:hypothetical protein